VARHRPLTAARRLRVDARDTIVLEDADAGIQAGQASAATVVVVQHRRAPSRGFDRSPPGGILLEAHVIDAADLGVNGAPDRYQPAGLTRRSPPGRAGPGLRQGGAGRAGRREPQALSPAALSSSTKASTSAGAHPRLGEATLGKRARIRPGAQGCAPSRASARRDAYERGLTRDGGRGLDFFFAGRETVTPTLVMCNLEKVTARSTVASLSPSANRPTLTFVRLAPVL